MGSSDLVSWLPLQLLRPFFASSAFEPPGKPGDGGSRKTL